ncbi:MAG: hypothetical protein IJI43_03880 [Bacilli bacterium]|nr:hypothetical protein [Bacilli bacterium]
MINSFYVLSFFGRLEDKLSGLNEKLNDFFGTYLSNPFAGTIIMVILLVIMWAAVKGFSSK